MSAIDRLAENYRRHVALTWARRLAGKQRVWFAVYAPADERRVRARLPVFETATLEAHRKWQLCDLTGLLAQWIASHDYCEEIFAHPEHFSADDEIEALAAKVVRDACSRHDVDDDAVVAVTGLASLFDFIRVSSLIDRVEDSVRGRLLVFFPGDFAGHVYRFMDARDGFNYMAVPITSAERFIAP